MNSHSDVFGPLGRTAWDITWEVSVESVGSSQCRFTNHILVYATDDFLGKLNERAISMSQARDAAQRAAHAHNEEEAPLFAADIERKAVAGQWL